MSRPPSRKPLRCLITYICGKSVIEGWEGLAFRLDWFRAKHRPRVLAILLVDNTAPHTNLTRNRSRLDDVSLSETKRTHASLSQTTNVNGRSGVGWRAHTAGR